MSLWFKILIGKVPSDEKVPPKGSRQNEEKPQLNKSTETMKAISLLLILSGIILVNSTPYWTTMPDWNTWTSPPYSTSFTIPATPSGISRNFETDKAPYWTFRKYQYAFHSAETSPLFWYYCAPESFLNDQYLCERNTHYWDTSVYQTTCQPSINFEICDLPNGACCYSNESQHLEMQSIDSYTTLILRS